MVQLKQKTISVGQQRQTIELVRLNNPGGGRAQFIYEVRDADTKELIEDPVTTKKEGLRLFRESVDQIERGMQAFKEDKQEEQNIFGDDLLSDDLGGLF